VIPSLPPKLKHQFEWHELLDTVKHDDDTFGVVTSWFYDFCIQHAGGDAGAMFLGLYDAWFRMVPALCWQWRAYGKQLLEYYDDLQTS